MVFADRQDIGRMRDTYFHRGCWVVPGVVVYLILCTRIAGGTPRPSCSDHGLRVGLLLPKPIRDANYHGCAVSDLDGASIGVRWRPSRAVAMVSDAEPPWRVASARVTTSKRGEADRAASQPNGSNAELG
jgi:hypothetical protein